MPFPRKVIPLLAVLIASCGGGHSGPVATTAAPAADAPGVILPTDRTTTSTLEASTIPSQLSPITAAVLRALGAVQTEQGIQVPVSGDVLFDTGSATLRPDAAPVLGQLVTAARGLPSSRIRITGHTDDQGGDAYNQQLSEQRAQAVADALRARDASFGPRLEVLGRGKSVPVATNATPEGRQKNRRVEILFVGAKL